MPDPLSTQLMRVWRAEHDWECDCPPNPSGDHTEACKEEFERNAVEWLSLGWEAETGYDSIATIERVYEQTRSGAYVCVYPGCSFTRKDSHAMWRHVHAAAAHGTPSLPPDDFDPGPWL